MPTDTETKPLQEFDLAVVQTNEIAIRDERKAELIATLKPIAERMAGYEDAVASLKITSKADAIAAAELRDRIVADGKTSVNTINDFEDGLIGRLDKLHGTWCRMRSLFKDPFDRLAKEAKQHIIKYNEEEAARARAVQEKLQREADERARKERERQEAEAAKQRAIEQEALRKAEEAKRAAEAALAAERKRLAEAQAALDAEKNKAKREKMEREAVERAKIAELERQRLERETLAAQKQASAAAAKAEVREEKAAAVLTHVVHVEASKVGVKSSKRWFCIGVNLDAFLEAAAKDPSLQGFIKVDTGALQRSKAANAMFNPAGVSWEHRSV